MAEYLIQEETLSGIADAIRMKTGKTDLINGADIADAINLIDADLTAIKQAIELCGIEVSDEDTIATLAEKINYLGLLLNPWDEYSQAGTDALGDFTFGSYNVSTSINPPNNGGYIKLKKLPEDAVIMGFPSFARNGTAVDISSHTDGTSFRYKTRITPATGRISDSLFYFRPSRLILPETFNYSSYLFGFPANATYLSKHATSNSSNWCNSANSNAVLVKCPKDADVPYYLHKFTGLTAECIVELFENMIDRSGETTIATITLGETNLAKLTEEQKNIAYAKGWNLA